MPVIHMCHEHSAPVEIHDQAMLLELHQRFEDRDAADAKLAGNLAFVEPVTRAVTAGHDRVAEALEDV